MGAKEVADLLGVTRQRVGKITQTHQDFPQPVGVLAAGRVWIRAEIVSWATRAGRRVSTKKRLRH